MNIPRYCIRLILFFFAFIVLPIPLLAQVRQTHLYIDDGSGNFTILSAPPGGGTIMFPGSGTLLTSIGSQQIGGTLSLGTNGSGGVAGQLNILSGLNPGSMGSITWNGTAFNFGSASLTTTGPANAAYYAIGGDTILSIAGTGNLFTGIAVGLLNTGTNNTASGNRALNKNQGGGENSAFGGFALRSNTSGSNNTADGYIALNSNSSGQMNTGIGVQALFNNTLGSYNTGVGVGALSSNLTGTKNTALGFGADVGSNSLTNATALGNGAIVTASNTLQLGNTSVNAVNTSGIITTGDGTDTGAIKISDNASHYATLDVPNATNAPVFQLPAESAAGPYTLATTADVAAATSAWTLTGNSGTNSGADFIGTTDSVPLVFKVYGTKAGYIGLGAHTDNNVGLGDSALASIQSGFGDTDNTAIGAYALSSTQDETFGDNTAIGAQSQRYTNATIGFNTSVGAFTMSVHSGDAEDNSALGADALHNVDFGQGNTAIGTVSLIEVTGDGTGNGSYNTAIGYSTGQNITLGSNNTLLGAFTGVSSPSASNRTAIGYQASAAADNEIQLGNTSVNAVLTSGTITTGDGADTGAIKISDNASHFATLDAPNATNAPVFQLPAESAAGPYTLATTADVAAATSAWTLTGNSGTSAGTDFIGTTDSVPLVFKVYGTKAGYIGLGAHTDNNVGLGDSALASIQSGFGDTDNTAIGAYALSSTHDEDFGGNTAIGAQSQRYTDATDGLNSSVGAFTMSVHSGDAEDNSALGAFALHNVDVGDDNTAVGSFSLYANTSAGLNTAIGRSSGFNITTGSNNTLLGANADVSSGNASNRTAIGYQAVAAADNTIQLGNTSVTAVNTSGYYQIGGSTVLSNAGTNNLFVGANAGAGTGSGNTAIGSGATVTAGANATAIGNGASVSTSNTIQLGNTSVTAVNTSGYYQIGGTTVLSNAGTNNLFVGANAGAGTGSGNTAIGSGATVTAGANATAIGNGASVSTSNTIQLGNTSVTDIRTSAALDAGGAINADGASSTANAAIAFKDGHLESQQTTAPTIVATPGLGNSPSINLFNATDVAGKIQLTAGSTGSYGAGTEATITLNKTFTTAGTMIVLISPADATSANINAYAAPSAANTFNIGFAVTPVASATYTFYYHIIQTQ